MPPVLDPFAPGAPESLVLVAARVTGLMLIAPSLATTVVPRLVRAGLIVIFTILLQPAAHAHAVAPILTPATLATELLVGLSIGLGAAIIVGAAEMAGDAMAVQIGLSGSAILDPIDTTAQLPVLGVLTRIFAVALLLTLDLHHVMLSTLAESFTVVAPSAPAALPEALFAMVRAGSALFAIGLRFAAPVIAVVLLTNIALAILTRAAPQINLLSVSFPIQIGIGLFALAAALPAMGRTLASWSSVYHDIGSRLSGAFLLAPR